MNPALGKAIMDVFPVSERGIAMGVKQMGLTLGGLVAALALPAIAATLGWRYAVGACSVIVAAGGRSPRSTLVRAERRPQPARANQHPAGGRRAGPRWSSSSPPASCSAWSRARC